MNIAIDTSVTKVTAAGASTYVKELLGALSADEKRRVTVNEFCYKPKFTRKNRVLRTLDTVNRELIWLQKRLPALVKGCGAGLLHAPAMMAPNTLDFPIVLTIFDMYILRNPGAFPLWQRNMMKFSLPKILARSAKIIAISEFTKQEILNVFPEILENKVAVTLLGVNNRFKRCEAEATTEFKKRHSLERSYILAVSTIEPRKNIKTLLKAFAGIKDKIEHDLLLVGSYGWKSKDVPELIHDLKINDRVKFTGFLDFEDLPTAYSGADLFVYPSLYEGFGLPPLEAMACGCPVITSNAASLPEAVGDAAVKINPHSVEELSNAIVELVMDSNKTNKLKDKGMEQVKKFSWERCAEETVSVYRQVLEMV